MNEYYTTMRSRTHKFYVSPPTVNSLLFCCFLHELFYRVQERYFNIVPGVTLVLASSVLTIKFYTGRMHSIKKKERPYTHWERRENILPYDMTFTRKVHTLIILHIGVTG